MNDESGQRPGYARTWRTAAMVADVWVPTGVDTKSTQFRVAAKTCGVPVPPAVDNERADRVRPTL
ncbi:MAG: hypothetical protein ACRDOA_24010 [Streptosporangiaceae bacterium]